MSAFRVALLGLCLLFNQAQARQDPNRGKECEQ